jgi:HEAT repeat protein
MDALLKALGSRNDAEARKAVRELIDVGRPAVGPLVELLRTEDSVTGGRAKEALRGIGEPAVEPLVQALGSRERMLLHNAAQALHGIGAPAVPSLVRATHDGNPAVRKYAVGTLGRIALEPEKALDRETRRSLLRALVAALGDTEVEIRNNALSFLREISGRNLESSGDWEKWLGGQDPAREGDGR